MGWLDKEYIGMNFANLVEPDISMRAAKKQTMVASGFKLAPYNQIYWNWKKSYRARFSETKLKLFGFEPYIGGESVEENIIGMTAFMQGIDAAYHHTIDFNVGITDEYTQLIEWMQWNGHDYSIKERKLYTNGDTYRYSYTSYLEDDDPYTPDDKSVIVGHFREDSSGDFIEIQMPNVYGKSELFKNIYSRDEDGSEYYIYLAFKDSVPPEIYNLDEYLISPVIPLTENGTISENSDRLRQMLREYGVSTRDFEETLEGTDDDGEPAIDNAYMLNGMPMLNPYEIEARFYAAEEAQNLSAAFLDTLGKGIGEDDEPDVDEPIDEEEALYDQIESDLEGTNFDISGDDDTAEPTEAEVEAWYNSHTKEQAYLARGLFKTFAYYGNAIDMDILEEEKFSLIYIGDSIADRVSEHASSPPVNKYEKIIKTDHPWQDADVDITVIHSGLKMRYGYDMSIVTLPGRVRPDVIDKRAQGNFHYSGRMHSVLDDEGDRDYWETDDSDGYDKLIIQVQKTIDTYQEMTITNYRADYDLGSHGFAVGQGAPTVMNRIILPYFVLDDLKFREYVTVADHSVSIFIYAYKEVAFDWFSFGLKVIFTVIACMTGSGCTVAIAIWDVAVMVITDIALSYLLQALDSEILLTILKLAMQVYQMTQGSFDLTDIPTEAYLKLATDVAKQAGAAVIMEMMNGDIEEPVDEQSAIQDKIDTVDNAMNTHGTAIKTAHDSFMNANDPGVFYETMYGSSLFNFEQFYNVDGEIELRKQVKSG